MLRIGWKIINRANDRKKLTFEDFQCKPIRFTDRLVFRACPTRWGNMKLCTSVKRHCAVDSFFVKARDADRFR